jgi:hypothetical protein
MGLCSRSGHITFFLLVIIRVGLLVETVRQTAFQVIFRKEGSPQSQDLSIIRGSTQSFSELDCLLAKQMASVPPSISS